MRELAQEEADLAHLREKIESMGTMHQRAEEKIKQIRRMCREGEEEIKEIEGQRRRWRAQREVPRSRGL